MVTISIIDIYNLHFRGKITKFHWMLVEQNWQEKKTGENTQTHDMFSCLNYFNFKSCNLVDTA